MLWAFVTIFFPYLRRANANDLRKKMFDRNREYRSLIHQGVLWKSQRNGNVLHFKPPLSRPGLGLRYYLILICDWREGHGKVVKRLREKKKMGQFFFLKPKKAINCLHQ